VGNMPGEANRDGEGKYPIKQQGLVQIIALRT
jgi:hypothetical protein